jgi:hydroxymethylpyrimidine pyrophosphatase-like HAD family hydrolase
VRCVYLDLDATLLGRRGSLLHDGEGATSLLGVRALEACLRAGVEIVLMSGRRKDSVSVPAHLFGSDTYIFEVGACLVLDGEEQWLTGDLQPGEKGTIFEQIAASGAPALLLDRYAGRLEYHHPWHHAREVSHLFRGRVDAFEANELLAANGHGNLRLVDNGAMGRGGRHGLGDLDGLRVYHLIPDGVSKARAVAAHMRARGLERGDCIAVGDSREDLAVAPLVGAFWLVANAIDRDPTIREAIPGLNATVRIAEAGYGPGVYEAVVTTLAERR